MIVCAARECTRAHARVRRVREYCASILSGVRPRETTVGALEYLILRRGYAHTQAAPRALALTLYVSLS